MLPSSYHLLNIVRRRSSGINMDNVENQVRDQRAARRPLLLRSPVFHSQLGHGSRSSYNRSFADIQTSQFARSSAIPRPPTRMPVPSFHGATSGAGGVLKGLQELSNSQSNARAGIPTQVTTKRGIAELSRKQSPRFHIKEAPSIKWKEPT